jgi:uncharacterized damage-inducible protein DinB
MDEKALLFAKLATERAGLWWELIGLSEETLTTQPIFADWTAKDILAHIAAWDEIHCERLRLALAGRPADIPDLLSDAVNERLHAGRQDWPLAQAVETCLAARAGFLSLVEPLSWEQMAVVYTMAWGDRRSIFDWCQRRMWHDSHHAADIRKWREAAGIKGQVGPKVVLEAALAAGRAELLAWAGLVPETERVTRLVCGEWTLKDVLGHVADWERFCVDAFADMAAGRVAGLSYTGDEEGWNRAHAAGRRDQPWQTAWADFTQTRQALMATLAGMEDAGLDRPARSRWSADDRPYWWFRGCLAHDREHAEGLRAALGQA